MHHMLGGVRHLIWDFGYGMEPGTRIAMARATPIAAVALPADLIPGGRWRRLR